LVLTKSRTDPEGASHAFDLKDVIVAYDDLDPVYSAYLIECDEARQTSRSRGLSMGVRKLKSALEQARLDYGYDSRVFADGPILKVVERHHVRNIFFANFPADGDAKKVAATRRQAFIRACNAAESIGLVKCYDTGAVQLMWLLRE
jgi:hypothetical protein